MDAAYLTLAILTLVSATPSLGYAVLSVREAAGDHERTVVALYAATRSVALFVIALVPLVHRNDGWLTAAAVAMIIVQGLDVLVGVRRRQAAMIAGPAVLSLAVLVALLFFLL